MKEEYKFENTVEGIVWPIKDGKAQWKEEPDLSYTVYYKEGLKHEEIFKRLIAHFVESLEFYVKYEEETKAKRSMEEALPVIKELINNPTFIKSIEDGGFTINSNKIFEAFKEAFYGKGK